MAWCDGDSLVGECYDRENLGNVRIPDTVFAECPASRINVRLRRIVSVEAKQIDLSRHVCWRHVELITLAIYA